RRAVDLDEWALITRAESMDQVGNDLFAGAAVAGDQNGYIARRDALNRAHDGFHLCALENRGGIAAHPLESVDEFAVFLGLLFAFERAFDQAEQTFVMRLGLEMESAAFGGFDSRVESAETSQHDDLRLRPLPFHAGKQIEPVGIR